MKIKKGDTFFQWRKDRRLAPIILEVLKVVDDREGYRGIYQVLWHILEPDKVYTSTRVRADTPKGVPAGCPDPEGLRIVQECKKKDSVFG